MRASLPATLVCLLLAVLATGCAGESQAGSVPASASVVPADATAYVSLVTDAGAEQWQRAEALLDAVPGARNGLVQEIERQLASEGLSWSEDVDPALGPELVVVASAGGRPVVLTQPDDAAALSGLLQRADEPSVQGEVDGWTAIAEREADLVAYRASLEAGALADSAPFGEAISGLPADALARAWVDLTSAAEGLDALLREAGTEVELGLESLAAAVSAQEDGLLVTLAVRTPEDTGSTSYTPALLKSVPADAVAALSFGGTQETVDRIGDMVDLGALSGRLEDATGLSLDGVLDALSGEGVLYARPGEPTPELTLVLAPPDVDEAFATVDGLVRRLAEQRNATVSSSESGGLQVFGIAVDGAEISYARLDDAVIVTTGATGIADFRGDGPKLVDTESFERAAATVGFEDRTSGLAYVDIAGIVALADRAGATDVVPGDARSAVDALDAFILQADRDGDTTTLDGFVVVD
jgi:hypothetical protein